MLPAWAGCHGEAEPARRGREMEYAISSAPRACSAERRVHLFAGPVQRHLRRRRFPACRPLGSLMDDARRRRPLCLHAKQLVNERGCWLLLFAQPSCLRARCYATAEVIYERRYIRDEKKPKILRAGEEESRRAVRSPYMRGRVAAGAPTPTPARREASILKSAEFNGRGFILRAIISCARREGMR